jgi:hypothetical protein
MVARNSQTQQFRRTGSGPEVPQRHGDRKEQAFERYDPGRRDFD